MVSMRKISSTLRSLMGEAVAEAPAQQAPGTVARQSAHARRAAVLSCKRVWAICGPLKLWQAHRTRQGTRRGSAPVATSSRRRQYHGMVPSNRIRRLAEDWRRRRRGARHPTPAAVAKECSATRRRCGGTTQSKPSVAPRDLHRVYFRLSSSRSPAHAR